MSNKKKTIKKSKEPKIIWKNGKANYRGLELSVRLFDKEHYNYYVKPKKDFPNNLFEFMIVYKKFSGIGAQIKDFETAKELCETKAKVILDDIKILYKKTLKQNNFLKKEFDL